MFSFPYVYVCHFSGAIYYIMNVFACFISDCECVYVCGCEPNAIIVLHVKNQFSERSTTEHTQTHTTKWLKV